MRSLLVILFIGGVILSSEAQSKAVEQFQKTTDGYQLYLYQSMIRMLNQEKDPDFNMLIRNLDHLKLIVSEDLGLRAKTAFRRLDEQVQKEGYEEVMSFDNKDSRCHLYEKKDEWVAVFQMETYSGVFEMKGELDLEYIRSLESLDMEKVKELFSLDEIIDIDEHEDE